MDVCGEIRWADAHCHPNRVVGGLLYAAAEQASARLLFKSGNHISCRVCKSSAVFNMYKAQVQSFTPVNSIFH